MVSLKTTISYLTGTKSKSNVFVILNSRHVASFFIVCVCVGGGQSHPKKSWQAQKKSNPKIMKILIWGCWGVTNSNLIQFCISILKKNVCLKKGGAATTVVPDSKRKVTAGKVRFLLPRALPDTARQNCFSSGRPDTLKEVYIFSMAKICQTWHQNPNCSFKKVWNYQKNDVLSYIKHLNLNIVITYSV